MYRVVNPQLAPPGFLQSFPNHGGCPVNKMVTMSSTGRAIALAIAVVYVSGQSLAWAQTADSPRARLVQALEALIATESSGHTTHDDGEWLQLAVTDSIRRGDREIERLAVRAAAPLRDTHPRGP